jgi:lipopolysaccharide transport system ATP-binding protein
VRELLDPSLAIRVEDVSKRYQLGALSPSLFSERLGRVLRPSRRSGATEHHEASEFWALRDLNLDVRRGEVVGVIGRNGAGKSTLLKILSRITLPTNGRALVRGRVGTLLEVGTGFHPELTGRENIFLNGAILGMRRREIGAKYKEIVEFSGVERFLETPVKRYSSGMHVRLAFAVAAHLEPEILLVDEVLAVGDAEFQQKCLGKMRDVASHGRTVLFVSHSLGAIRRLCDRAVLLEEGVIAADGEPADVIATYMEQALPAGGTGGAEVPPNAARLGTGEARLRRVGLTDSAGEPLAALHLNQRFRIIATFDAEREIEDAVVEFGISTFGGDRIATVQSIDGEGPLLRFPAGRNQIWAELDTSLLPGEFTVDVGIHRRSGETIDYVADSTRFTALNAAEVGTDHYPWSVVRGYVRPRSTWSAVLTPSSVAGGVPEGPR